jgi:hypothetical protein
MPIFRRFVSGNARVAVWRLDESVGQLAQLAGVDVSMPLIVGCRSSVRKRELLAVRALLRSFVDEKAGLVYDRYGKPLLDGVEGFISVSHTKGYVAVAYSLCSPVGVDIELLSRDVGVTAARFVHKDNMPAVVSDTTGKLALLHWCAKEALFKVVGDLGGTFGENISISPVQLSPAGLFTAEIVGLDLRETHYPLSYVVDGGLLLVLCGASGSTASMFSVEK